MDKELDLNKAVQLLIDLIEEQERVTIKYELTKEDQDKIVHKNGDNRT